MEKAWNFQTMSFEAKSGKELKFLSAKFCGKIGQLHKNQNFVKRKKR